MTRNGNSKLIWRELIFRNNLSIRRGAIFSKSHTSNTRRKSFPRRMAAPKITSPTNHYTCITQKIQTDYLHSHNFNIYWIGYSVLISSINSWSETVTLTPDSPILIWRLLKNMSQHVIVENWINNTAPLIWRSSFWKFVWYWNHM